MTGTTDSSWLMILTSEGYADSKFNVIGVNWVPFTGVFDGDHHMISGFHYADIFRSYVGLFGWVLGRTPKSEMSTYSNLPSPYRMASASAALSAVSSDRAVTNCAVTDVNMSTFGGRLAGGLIGLVAAGTIANRQGTARVYARSDAGGLVGRNDGGTDSECSVAADVTVCEGWAGGLTGSNHNHGTISGCSSTGSVAANSQAGGLVGVQQLPGRCDELLLDLRCRRCRAHRWLART